MLRVFFFCFFFACVCVFARMFLIRELRRCIVWSFRFGLRLKSQQIQRSIMWKNGIHPISICCSSWSEEGRTTHSLPRSLKPMLLCHTPLFSLLTLQGTLKHLWLSWGYGGSLVRFGEKNHWHLDSDKTQTTVSWVKAMCVTCNSTPVGTFVML